MYILMYYIITHDGHIKNSFIKLKYILYIQILIYKQTCNYQNYYTFLELLFECDFDL